MLCAYLRQASPTHVVEEPRGWFRAGYEKLVTRACVGHVEQVPFGVVHVFKIALVRDRLYPRLEGSHPIIAGHDCHCPELQPLCQVHRADGNPSLHTLNLRVENRAIEACLLSSSLRAAKLPLGPANLA